MRKSNLTFLLFHLLGWAGLIFRPVRVSQFSQAIATACRNHPMFTNTTEIVGMATVRKGRSKKSRSTSASRSPSPRHRPATSTSLALTNPSLSLALGSTQAPRILVVDDFEMMRELVQRTLQTTLG